MKRTVPRRRATPTPSASSGFLLSPDQVAARLGISPKTLHNWRYLGKGPRGLKVGRYLRFRREDIDAWILEGKILFRHPRKYRAMGIFSATRNVLSHRPDEAESFYLGA